MQEITNPDDHHLLVEDHEIGITTDMHTYPISHGLDTVAASNPKAIASNKQQTDDFFASFGGLAINFNASLKPPQPQH